MSVLQLCSEQQWEDQIAGQSKCRFSIWNSYPYQSKCNGDQSSDAAV